MARIRFDKVGKRYANGFVALESFDLDIRDREFLVLLGPSGCGKSTSLNMIAGLEEVTDGTLWFDDQRMNEVPAHRRDVAMVFQSYALYPHKSVYENIAFGLRMRKHPASEIDERVRDAARRLDIESLLERRPQQLSGGQRQRVALGRAMVRRAEVFLMDEPLSNLDATLRVSMRAEIKQLHHTMQSTFVYVTHDQAEALTLADRIIVMRSGVVQQTGQPEAIYERPANMFVASFLGNPAINYLRGSIEIDQEGPWFRRGDIRVRLRGHPAACLGECNGMEVMLGLRAEDVLEGISTEDRDADGVLVGRITSVMPVGSDQYLGLEVQGSEVYVRVGKEGRYREGENVSLGLIASRLHLFDPTSEQNLVLRSLGQLPQAEL